MKYQMFSVLRTFKTVRTQIYKLSVTQNLTLNDLLCYDTV
jgi:hypothetical protein